MTMSPGFKYTLVALGLALAGAAVALLHLDNVRLQRRIDTRAAEGHVATQLRHENDELRAVLATAKQAGDRHEAVRAQLAQVRTEIETLERQANERFLRKQQQDLRDAAALASNRDPMSGFVRLEYFESRGQATPSAAFQSAVAAALKGDAAAITDLAVLEPETRAKAEALLARLPPEARAQWTPEKLMAMWVTGALTEISALQITGESFQDAQHAVVTFRPMGEEKDERVKMRLTPVGWKVILPANVVDKLARKMGAVGP